MSEVCRNCQKLKVLGTGSQIILICTITSRWKNYEDPCDCERFEEKIKKFDPLGLENGDMLPIPRGRKDRRTI